VVAAARVSLPEWIETNVRLPAGTTAEPGPIKLYPYQRGIAQAIGDPKIERVTVIKSARVGYTAVMTAGLAHFIVREPSPILVLMPTEADCRDYCPAFRPGWTKNGKSLERSNSARCWWRPRLDSNQRPSA
jgi:phage terminase large subunit GpA-like protein